MNINIRLLKSEILNKILRRPHRSRRRSRGRWRRISRSLRRGGCRSRCGGDSTRAAGGANPQTNNAKHILLYSLPVYANFEPEWMFSIWTLWTPEKEEGDLSTLTYSGFRIGIVTCSRIRMLFMRSMGIDEFINALGACDVATLMNLSIS